MVICCLIQAPDKIRFCALANKKVLGEGYNTKLQAQRYWMTKEDLEKYLRVIATYGRSGCSPGLRSCILSNYMRSLGGRIAAVFWIFSRSSKCCTLGEVKLLSSQGDGSQSQRVYTFYPKKRRF